jgi:elongation factor P--beta-lysine ligase
LRYNPEPDIWQVGIKHNNFFWIGSMFRNEGKLSDLHQYEFTVVDIYQSNGKMNNVVQKFIELLKNLEKELNLRNLSDLEIKYMTHEEFVEIDKKKVNTKHWLIVIDYPAEESFYDTKEKDSDTTSKFEIFFAGKNGYVEVAACGNLGQNLNDKNFIPDKPDLLNKELLDKKFIGFGIGLERLIFLYDMK